VLGFQEGGFFSKGDYFRKETDIYGNNEFNYAV
jgi:hypothetical protein